MKKRVVALALLALLAVTGASSARADMWDLGSDPDNGPGTDNVLFHAAQQVHDVAALPGPAADQDWYLVAAQPFSSYQFLVDGQTGRLDLAAAGVQRLAADGATVLQSAEVLELGGVLSLSWLGPATATPLAGRVRVQGAGCGTSCNSADRYRVRMYDTTYTVPRFSNSGTQSTVLLLQNATDRSCTLTAYFFADAGLLVGTADVGRVTPHQLVVLATAAVAPNLSGWARIAHTCGYGGLSGKAVALEPATGFTFDTRVLPRPAGGSEPFTRGPSVGFSSFLPL